MVSSYAGLFRQPGTRAFFLGSLLGRIGGAMFGVSVIIMISTRTGSFALAGLVGGLATLVLAAAGPYIGRLADKYGQRAVVPKFAAWAVTMGLTTAVLSASGAPAWLLTITWATSAFAPELAPLTRSRWVFIYRNNPAKLHAAMSLEQVADEGAFVIGPVIGILAATLWFPEAGVVLAELSYLIGIILVMRSRATEPPVVPRADRPLGLAVQRPGLLTVALTLTMTGAIFGSNEVIVVAFADELGQPVGSTYVLAAFALGSMLAGLVMGALKLRSSLAKRLLVFAAAMVLLESPALIAPDVLTLTLVMGIAGCATAPTLITGLSLAQHLVPDAFVTEAIAVAITGLFIGVSVGTFTGGLAVEAFGPSRAFLVPIAAGALAVTIVATRFRSLRAAERASTPEPTWGGGPGAENVG